MSSGHKRLKTNTRERAVSPDVNRAQSFLAAGRAETLRFLLNLLPSATDRPYERGNPLLLTDLPTAVDTPLRADVLEGLVVRPIVGNNSVHISPGVGGLMDPDGQAGSSDANPPSTDDSDYKLVESGGIRSNGVLTIAANASGSARIDVIECQRNPNVVVETDTRDIFDLGQGTFVPTPNVDKVLEGQLAFRVRQGTAGSGYPGNVQGWLPLAVAHVPSAGGADTDDIDFWDVRPLVSDRIIQPFRSSFVFGPPHEQQQLYADAISVGTETRISGHFWGQVDGVRVGGEISRGTPGTDQLFIDARDAEWQEPSFTPGAFVPYYFWLAFPFSLPRWCRYNRFPIGGLRFPSGMRGIPIISETQPATQAHETPATALQVPNSTGLDPAGANKTTDAVLVVAGVTDGTSVPSRFVCGGEWVELADPIIPATLAPSNGSGNASDEYLLLANTHFPQDARAVRIVFQARFIGTAGTNLVIFARAGYDHGGTRVSDAGAWHITSQFDAAGSIFAEVMADIPRLPEQSGIDIGVMSVRIDWSASGFTTKQLELLQVVGWKQTG